MRRWLFDLLGASHRTSMTKPLGSRPVKASLDVSLLNMSKPLERGEKCVPVAVPKPWLGVWRGAIVCICWNKKQVFGRWQNGLVQGTVSAGRRHPRAIHKPNTLAVGPQHFANDTPPIRTFTDVFQLQRTKRKAPWTVSNVSSCIRRRSICCGVELTVQNTIPLFCKGLRRFFFLREGTFALV